MTKVFVEQPLALPGSAKNMQGEQSCFRIRPPYQVVASLRHWLDWLEAGTGTINHCIFHNFQRIGPQADSFIESQFVSATLSVIPFSFNFFQAFHWPSGHMISSRPLISQPFFTTKLSTPPQVLSDCCQEVCSAIQQRFPVATGAEVRLWTQ